tara:strand:+ start:219 stop:503 length:285 start_codon:yes stop_codon:yes gene_type:complete
MYLSLSESGSRNCRLRVCFWKVIFLILLLVLAIFSSFLLCLLDIVLELIWTSPFYTSIIFGFSLLVPNTFGSGLRSVDGNVSSTQSLTQDALNI